MQKTFLNNFIKKYKDSTIDTETTVLLESGLEDFWVTILQGAGKTELIPELHAIIGDFQHAEATYAIDAIAWNYGRLEQIITTVLSHIKAIPKARDEFHFMISTIIITIIAFRLQYGKNIPHEREILEKTLSELNGQFLRLQKQSLNNAMHAFINSTYVDEVTHIQEFPIQFLQNGENYSFHFSDTFNKNFLALEQNPWDNFSSYTDIVTSCPAATGNLIPIMMKRLFNKIYGTTNSTK